MANAVDVAKEAADIVLLEKDLAVPEHGVREGRITFANTLKVDRPHRWDIGFIRRFMMVFGLVSSICDYLTFGALLYLLRRTKT